MRLGTVLMLALARSRTLKCLLRPAYGCLAYKTGSSSLEAALIMDLAESDTMACSSVPTEMQPCQHPMITVSEWYEYSIELCGFVLPLLTT